MTLHERYQRLYERRNRRERRALPWVALVLALLFHGVSLVLVLLAPKPPARPLPARPVTLRTLNPQQWAQNRGPAAPELPTPLVQTKPVPKPEAPKPKETLPKGQVVDVAPGNQEEDPNAKYLAETANRVAKETRAKQQTPFYKKAAPKTTSPRPMETPESSRPLGKAVAAGNHGQEDDARPAQGAREQRNAPKPEVKAREELALRMDPGTGPSNGPKRNAVPGAPNPLEPPHEASPGGEQPSPGKAGAPGMERLLPSSAFVDKLSQGAPNGHLSDVDQGEGTYLNTREWKYAGFFNRIKQSVAQHWDPMTQVRQHDPTGALFGSRDRYTVLSITLNQRGMIKDIYVEKSSGLDFLDLEAMKSFERAQPFPNPPPGFIDGQGGRFSFGFYLEMGEGARMRIFRQSG